MMVFTRRIPDSAHAVPDRVGFLVPEATGRVVDGESFRALLGLPSIAFSVTTTPAAITMPAQAESQ